MFLDTSGLLCVAHRAEPFHDRAAPLFLSANRLLTHNYVLAEFVALADKRGLPRDQALDFMSDIPDNRNVEMVWVDSAIHRAAIDLLLARRDKSYSLCDAVSFVLMRLYGIDDALTTDRHFEQEGFSRLLK